VHIEQGPVLNELDLPLGVVTSINGSRALPG
jgi:N-carbamoyl-L-amino-acid hydrolase